MVIQRVDIQLVDSFTNLAFTGSPLASDNPNILDDYEEGTFTPALSATGSTFSIATAIGTYVKVGQNVTFTLSITLNTSGNTLTANALSVTGLPFTNHSVPYVFHVKWTNSASSFANMQGYLFTGGTSLDIYALISGTSMVAANANTALHPTNGAVLEISGSYRANA